MYHAGLRQQFMSLLTTGFPSHCYWYCLCLGTYNYSDAITNVSKAFSCNTHLQNRLDRQGCHQPRVYHDQKFDPQPRKTGPEGDHEAACLRLLDYARLLQCQHHVQLAVDICLLVSHAACTEEFQLRP